MSAGAPARVTTIGPSSAKPTANAALRVSVNTPLAASSWRRGTRNGIIASSAGAKNTVIVDTVTLSSRINGTVEPTRKMSTKQNVRSRLVITRISRRSNRSTYTPATAENSTAGRRKLRMSTLTAVLDDVASRMITVSP